MLSLNPHDVKGAEESALKRLEQAFNNVKNPIDMMQYFSQGKDTLEFSSRLIHRWPSDDKHSKFRLEWASAYVAEKVCDLLTEDAYREILKDLVKDPGGSASGVMFEVYVLRIFREGGHTFELKDLKNGKLSQLTIPQQPDTVHFKAISEARTP
ncbi:hypothetical protein BGZ92_006698, partial [Podila epicladia]